VVFGLTRADRPTRSDRGRGLGLCFPSSRAPQSEWLPVANWFSFSRRTCAKRFSNRKQAIRTEIQGSHHGRNRPTHLKTERLEGIHHDQDGAATYSGISLRPCPCPCGCSFCQAGARSEQRPRHHRTGSHFLLGSAGLQRRFSRGCCGRERRGVRCRSRHVWHRGQGP
jgi:hypothetical protein